LQYIFGFLVIRIYKDAVDRTNFNTLWFIIVAYAFSTQVWIDFINFITLGDGAVRTFWLTNITIDAFIVD
jgi:hypothetical protein